MVIKFDKLKNLDVRNTCDILWKYCNLQMTNISVGSASVGFEQLSDQHVQKMAPKKTPKKVAKEAPAGKEPVDSSSDLINLLPTELLLLVTQVLGSSSLLTFVS